MKLYFSPSSCSMVPHIILQELKLPFELIAVNLKDKTYEGGDFRKVNPKGQVPTLVLDSGDTLTENAVILQYLASLKPEAKLLADSGIKKFHELERLNFMTTDVHKNFAPLFNPALPKEAADIFKETLKSKFAFIDEELKKREFFSGDHFGLADAYLYVMTTWARAKGIDIGNFAKLNQHFEKLQGRESINKAQTTERDHKRKV